MVFPFLLERSENRFFMFWITMKNASFSWENYIDYPICCQPKPFFPFFPGTVSIMQKTPRKGKDDFPTSSSLNLKKLCRIFKKDRKNGHARLCFNKTSYRFMSKIFFAFSVVALLTSSNVSPLISAICSATNFTYLGSFRFPR